mgnify:FL=1
MKSFRENDSEMQDIEEELRDVVFDYENSQALVAMADNFLAEDDQKSSVTTAPQT